MDGGLSKGELAVILAPFGVGKTTMMTYLVGHRLTLMKKKKKKMKLWKWLNE